jgi:hypothetical protein
MTDRRSELYSLKPIHDENWPIESLTGYLTRLTEAHSCLMGHLFKHLVFKCQFNDSIKQMMNRGGGAPLYKRSFLINGMGEGANHFKEAVEIATGRDDLIFTTLLPLQHLLTHWRLNSRFRRWCPFCYQESKTMLGNPYEQLLWTIETVKICPIHRYPLQERCSHCNKVNYFLAHRARAGHCYQCGLWLGFYSNQAAIYETDSWEQYVSENVCSLLKYSHTDSSHLTIQNAIEFIRKVIQEIYCGNISAFANSNMIPSTTLNSWLIGKHRPSLESLLRVAYQNHITILDLLLFDVTVYEVACSNQVLIQPLTKAISLSTQNLIKKRLCMTTELKIEIETIVENIVATLQHKPSVKEISALVGIHVLTFEKHFPDLRERFVRERKSEQLQCAKARREETVEQIKTAIEVLILSGIDPSIRNLEIFLQKRRISSLLYPEVYEIWQKMTCQMYNL